MRWENFGNSGIENLFFERSLLQEDKHNEYMKLIAIALTQINFGFL